jgi:hypothetical protein
MKKVDEEVRTPRSSTDITGVSSLEAIQRTMLFELTIF